MSMNTTTTTTEASSEDRRRVQGIGDNYGGNSGSTTVPVDWQRQWSVDLPCYLVSNSNTFLSLSIFCLVLVLFSSYSFLSFYEINTIITEIMRRYFCSKCTITLRIYLLRTGE